MATAPGGGAAPSGRQEATVVPWICTCGHAIKPHPSQFGCTSNGAATWVDSLLLEFTTQARDANPRVSVHGIAKAIDAMCACTACWCARSVRWPLTRRLLWSCWRARGTTAHANCPQDFKPMDPRALRDALERSHYLLSALLRYDHVRRRAVSTANGCWAGLTRRARAGMERATMVLDSGRTGVAGWHGARRPPGLHGVRHEAEGCFHRRPHEAEAPEARAGRRHLCGGRHVRSGLARQGPQH